MPGFLEAFRKKRNRLNGAIRKFDHDLKIRIRSGRTLRKKRLKSAIVSFDTNMKNGIRRQNKEMMKKIRDLLGL